MAKLTKVKYYDSFIGEYRTGYKLGNTLYGTKKDALYFKSNAPSKEPSLHSLQRKHCLHLDTFIDEDGRTLCRRCGKVCK